MADTDGTRAMRTSEIRASNASIVLRALRASSGMTRAELSAETSLTSQALGTILADLVADGSVAERVEASGGPGRPATRYSLVPTASLTVLLALRLREGEIYVANALGDLFAFRQLTPGVDDRASDVVELLMTELDALLEDTNLSSGRIERLTFAVDGAIDETTRVVHDSPAWIDAEVSVADLIRPFLARGVEIEVTSTATAVARAALAQLDPPGDELVAIVQLGFGTWMFLSQGGRILHSRNGRTGYLSHVQIPGNDRRCECGRVGCLATVVGHGAMARRYSERSGVTVRDGADVLDRLETGDADAIAVALEAGTWLVAVIAPLVRLADPDRLVIAGTVAPGSPEVGTRLIELIRKGLGPDLADLEIESVSPDLSRLLAG